MKSPEFITHGTISEKDAEKIKNEELLSSELQSKIKLIDESIFPDKPLNVHLDKNTESGAEASHHFDEKDSDNDKEHFYTVWEKGIQNKLDGKDNSEKEVLRIALREVRHRVQHDLNAQMLNINDLKQFMVENPKTLLETYFSSPDYRDFINYATSKSDNDFDAMVVENIAMKLLRGNYSDENIKKITNDIVKQPADVILDYLKKLGN